MRSPSRQARRAGIRSRLLALVGSVLLLAGLVPAATVVPVLASHTTAPTSVTIAGSLQSELGCPGDWQPECAATHLAFDTNDQVWQGTFAVPIAAAPYEYKAALNDTWDENYGANAALERRQHRPDGRRRQRDEVLLLPRDALGHEQPERDDRRRRPAASRARSAARATGRPTASGPGCRTRTATACTPSRATRSRPGAMSSRSRSTRPGIRPIPRATCPSRSVPPATWSRSPTRRRRTPWTSRSTAPPPPPGTTVALVGSLQSELGCPGDWQPECAATELTLGTDGVWRGDFTVPAGSWEYKVALNDTWDVNYGAGAAAGGGTSP